MLRDLITKVVYWALPYQAQEAWTNLNYRLSSLEDDFDELQDKVDHLQARFEEYVEGLASGRPK